MKIYTKQGDGGQTGLFGGARVAKDHLRIQAYGTLDELNATLGLVLAQHPALDPGLRGQLERIQSELFQLGTELATPSGRATGIRLLDESAAQAQEREIDAMEADLPPLKNFVLPGGHPASAALQLARTVCRRAERALVSLHHEEPQRPEPLRFLNRLSDYLFVAARWVNHRAGVADVPWTPEREAKRTPST
jgi:cob(I)alamin adenosyltransferase